MANSMIIPSISLSKFIIKHVLVYKKYVFGLLLVMAIYGIGQVLPSYVLKLIIDNLESHQPSSTIYFWITIYIGVTILFAANMRIKDWLHLKLFPVLRRNIIMEMFQYLQGHSYSYFQNRFSGSLSNKISDMNNGVIHILQILDEAGTVLLGLIFALILMYTVHPLFSLIFFVWTLLFIFSSLFFSRKIQNLSKQFSEGRSAVMGQIVDALSNIVNVWLFARSKEESDRLRNQINGTVSLDIATQWEVVKLRVAQDITIVLLIGLMIISLYHLYQAGEVTLGDLTFIIMTSISIFQFIWWVASQMVEFVEEVGKCKQALVILSDKQEIKSIDQAKDLVVTNAKIVFKSVTFQHKKATPLFKDLNLTIKAGEKVGLVGFSGSGKTTLTNLILRFFEVNEGHILIDDQDISQVSLDSLRRNISMIPQEPILFHRTLMENIRYGKPDASDEELIEASIKASCHSFITELPHGYNTMVGERGVKLSGGQRQRIAIARAILKNASILILDEATSALDSVTEKIIQDTLLELMKGRTALVIAHRLSTLYEMDRILVFEKGVLVEEGTHKELTEQGGHYAKMWELQAGGFLPDEEEDWDEEWDEE